LWKDLIVLRIAIFTDTFYPQINGVTNTFRYLSRYLSQNNIEHLFFAPDYDEKPDHSNLPVIRFRGITPHIYPECRLAFPPLGQIIPRLKAFAPDVVHIATELGLGFSGLRAARELNLPIVMSYHTNFDQYLNYYNLNYFSGALWSYMKWFHSFARVNLCPSADTLCALAQHGFPRLDIWSRGIDLDRFHPHYYDERTRNGFGGGQRTVFLYVGRIAKEKGLDTLAESIRIVNAKNQDKTLFVFTGDGPYLEELKSLGIPNMIFTGAKQGKELSRIYASCDVFVFPSGTETFGNVMLEAMASGLPGICVNSGGVTDFAVHLENAFVCEYQNSASLADAIVHMLDPQLQRKIQLNALETAKRRSWNTVFDSLLTHYRAAAEGGRYQNRPIAG
jgi:glycosyltransferase involved in cell wall biosynthesis